MNTNCTAMKSISPNSRSIATSSWMNEFRFQQVLTTWENLRPPIRPKNSSASKNGRNYRSRPVINLLDRYLARPKSDWEIGRLYERYLGHLRETNGWVVTYHGALRGFEDLGRDLICVKDKESKSFKPSAGADRRSYTRNMCSSSSVPPSTTGSLLPACLLRLFSRPRLLFPTSLPKLPRFSTFGSTQFCCLPRIR